MFQNIPETDPIRILKQFWSGKNYKMVDFRFKKTLKQITENDQH